LLSVLLTTVLTSGLLSRPTQADFLNPVTRTVGCLLNISTCSPPTDPPTTTDPGNTTTNPNNSTTTPPDDTTAPSVGLNAAPLLAGGTTQTINITGTVIDANLASYSLAINGTVAQAESNMTTTSANINDPWNVSTPNLVPSGTYLITLDATDTAGLTTHKEVSVEVDNTPPTVTLDGGDVILKSGSITPTTTANDTHGIASYTWTANANNPAVIDFDHTVAEPTFTPTVQGSYIYYLAVADGLGNVTTQEFDFSYAQELAIVPLPTLQDPTDALVDQSPSTLAVAPATANPTVQSGRDEATTSDATGVLGSTITAPGQMPPATNVATIVSTSNGWSIFGMLWYWWLIIASLLFSAWIVFKKFVISFVPEQS
jgi:large repetitive protein